MPEFILAVIYSALFIFIIRKHSFFHTESISRNAMTFAFIVKILFGFLFWAVYFFHASYKNYSDAFMYFEDGKAIYQALYEKPSAYLKILLGFNDPSLQVYLDNTGHWERTFNQGLYNETRTVIRFNAIVDIFSFGNYHVHTVFMCFLSFMGLTGIYKTFLPFFQEKKKELSAIVFFLPSVLFWGSGVLKEGLILFSEGMLLYHWFKMIKEGYSLKRSFYLLIFLLLLSVTKMYMLVILVGSLMLYTIYLKTKSRSIAVKVIGVLLLIFSSVLVLYKYDLPFMLMEKQRHSYNISRGGSYLGHINQQKFIYIDPRIENRIVRIKEQPGSCKISSGVPYIAWYAGKPLDTVFVNSSTDTTTYWIYYDQLPAGSSIKPSLLKPTYGSVLINTPAAFIITAFRPYLFEMKNPLMLLAAAENTFLILFILICLFFYTSPLHYKSLIAFSLLIAALLFVLTGLTTPILGAVVRYRVPALPFFLIAFLFILDKEKLLAKLPFLKKILG